MCPIGSQVFHCPATAYFSDSTMRRPAEINRAKAMSAVASVSTPGVFPTAIPRSVAAGISILLNPTA